MGRPPNRKARLCQTLAFDVDDRRLIPVVFTQVTSAALDLTAAIRQASDPKLGGIAVFIGTVRSSAAVSENDTRSVTALNYEAHPTLAEEKLAEIGNAAAARWDVKSIYAVHRTGTCELGEPTVVVACGAPHRGDALDACKWIIDTIKNEVPIWKQEVYADAGASAWVNTP